MEEREKIISVDQHNSGNGPQLNGDMKVLGKGVRESKHVSCENEVAGGRYRKKFSKSFDDAQEKRFERVAHARHYTVGFEYASTL